MNNGFDALILGGGPAGSTLATLLAQDGMRVALVERERMPRPHVGESLIPGVLPALDASGALPLVEKAGFTQKYGATYIWGRTREPWTVKFSEVYPDQAFAWQVDRARFDKLLLDHAAAEGVEVRQGVTALGPLGSVDAVQGARLRADDGRESELAADLTIDATGQDALFGRVFRTRQYNEALRHVALYGHWSGGRDLDEVIGSGDNKDAGNILIVTVPDGWIWHIPIAHTMRSVGLVTVPEAVANLNAANRTDYYLEQIRACPEIAGLLDGGEWVSERVEALSDWSFFCSRFTGPGFMQVGDAACFIDPILSTGVTLAVNGALRAARAIRTGRAAPWLQGLAMDWYETEYRSVATDFADLAEHWYGGHADADAWFWRAKKLADPTRNFSIRQAFIHLSAGVTGTQGAGGRLRSAGGYSPRQLQLIYDNLATDLDAESRTEIVNAESGFGGAPARAPTATSVLMGRARLGEAISYRPHMAEHDEILRPITRVTRLHPNAGPEHLELPIAALPVLELLDGRRSGLDIATDLRERHAGTPIEADLRDLVAQTLQRLAETGAVDLT